MVKPEIQAASRYRFVMYALLVSGNVVLGISFLGPAVLLPQIIDDYRIPSASAGFYASSLTLMITVCSIPAGLMGPRFGLRVTVGIALLLMASSILVPLIPGFLPLVLMRLLQGMGAGIFLPLQASVLMRWAPPREFASMNAVTVAAATVGDGSSLIFGSYLIGLLGWEMVLAIETIPALIAAVCWMLLAREGPGRGQEDRDVHPIPILDTLRLRTTWLLALAVAGPWALFSGMSAWLPTYFSEVRGLDLAVAAANAAIFSLIGIPASFAGAAVTNRLGRRRPILLGAGISVGAAAILTLYVPNGAFLMLAAALTGFLLVVYLPALFSVPMEMDNPTPHGAGAITGVIVMAGNGTSFLAPIIVGAIRDLTGGFQLGLGLMAVSSLSLVFATLLLPETGPARALRQRAQ